jgi:hypothetical protein
MLCMTAAAWGQEVAVSGKITEPGKELPAGTLFKLTGDTTFGWKTGEFAGDLDLNGQTFTMDTGGGNRTVLSGAITGQGGVVWLGGGTVHFQTVPSFLAGTKPNTFRGTLTIRQGMLALAKPAGVDAVPDDLVLGGGGNQAIVRLDGANQIHDSAGVLITGKCEGRIWTQGFDETLGTLDLQSFGYIDPGSGGRLAFADSSSKAWDLAKTLTIQHWTEGKSKVTFGTTAAGLTARQVARVGAGGRCLRASAQL